MPSKARTVYVLTQDGQIQGATYDQHKADNWVGLGPLYDYVPVKPEDIASEGNAPSTAQEYPGKVMERSKDLLQQHQELMRKLDKKGFKSPLLRP